MKKYIPHLIPNEYKVLPEYFKEIQSRTKEKGLNNLRKIISIPFFLMFLLSILITPLFAVTILFAGFIILPYGKRTLETLLKFNFTQSLQLKTLGIISILALYGGNQFYNKIEFINEQNRLEEQRRVAIQKVAERKEKQRNDSLNYYLNESDRLNTKKKLNSAIQALKNAQKFAKAEDIEQIDNRFGEIYYNNNDYKKAIIYFEKNYSSSSEVNLKKGICYKKIGNIENAIIHLKQATDSGNKEAEKEYNKVNPIIKHIIGYQTLCCDGSYSPSNAKGRGACSHHGGVCNWNAPIYSESRKYEVSNF